MARRVDKTTYEPFKENLVLKWAGVLFLKLKAKRHVAVSRGRTVTWSAPRRHTVPTGCWSFSAETQQDLVSKAAGCHVLPGTQSSQVVTAEASGIVGLSTLNFLFPVYPFCHFKRSVIKKKPPTKTMSPAKSQWCVLLQRVPREALV